MADPDDQARWRAAFATIDDAAEVFVVQLATRWLTDREWATLRDQLDLALFRAALRNPRARSVRRLLLYDPPSDLGGAVQGYQRAKLEHQQWLARVRRQLAALGARSSAGGSLPQGCDYQARLVILPRAGQPSTIKVNDGIWTDDAPPADVTAAWQADGLIPLDPHEENIVGPHSDRNPLWAGGQS